MKAVANFECKNAKMFLTRSTRSHTYIYDNLDVGVLPAICAQGVYSARLPGH